MSKEVSINMDVFRSNIEKIRETATSLKTGIKTNRTFKKTNIKPFINDLENIIKGVELLERYKQLLIEDIYTLKHVGEQMRENDERQSQKLQYSDLK
ncbi:TIGR04197 family type VII secretion effector [Virgibacillus proomii]|uniref:TIGR04197 family type VII secretion effector n=1 Tax=Virgibacillus proomii TaxID=84407 RepID=UPI0009868726|nr:TIGR04197 family type VII secretion effector [Virgibacillus proomii]